MTTKNKILIFIIIILLSLMIYSEQNQKQINWFPSFSVKHKIPFGSYIAYQEAKELFKDRFYDVAESPYIFFKKNSDVNGTFVLYNQQVGLGETNWNVLKEWVKNGNNLLISSTEFEKEILDSLGFKQKWHFNKGFNARTIISLLNPTLQSKDSIVFDKGYQNAYFDKDSITNTYKYRFLGKIFDKENDSLYNFIEINYGKGKIYLHAFPYAFTNYFILKENNVNYYEGLLSYINTKKPVYWNTHYQNGSKSGGIFTYLLQNKSFLWAYRILFFGLILYILFEGKRKQRAIRVIPPLKNQTISFTKTIADMYLVNNEHQQIAQMHIKHFIDYVRNQLKLDTRKWDSQLMKRIAEKSNSDYKDVKAIFSLIQQINTSDKVLTQQVLKLEKYINKIKS